MSTDPEHGNRISKGAVNWSISSKEISNIDILIQMKVTSSSVSWQEMYQEPLDQEEDYDDGLIINSVLILLKTIEQESRQFFSIVLPIHSKLR